MAPPLSNGAVEYDDGTPATVSQMAKDVSTFLAYSSSKEQDERKKMGLKAMVGFTILAILTYYHKRFRWSLLKSRRIQFEE
jgi:ubiquinol-cytochrome c reductase cytochrome c1 subunit